MTEPHPEASLPPEPATPEGVEDVPRVDFDVHTGEGLGQDEFAPDEE